MALKLNSSSGGSVTLQEPTTASNYTLTVPAQTATLAINGPAFAAYQATSQTGVANTTAVKLTFDTEEYDTNNNFASSRFTPTVAGYYQINASGSVGTTTTTYGLQVGIYKNGSAYKWGTWNNANSAGYPYSSCSSLVYLNGTTDYIEIYVYGVMGGTYSILTGVYATWFNGCLLRAA